MREARGSRLARSGAAIVLLWFCAGTAHGHLLNMTEVVLEIGPDGAARLTMDLDLTREFGSPRAYFEFSRSSASGSSDEGLTRRWDRLAEAVELRQAGGRRVPLQWVSVTPPQGATLEDFESPFVWPRTRVVLQGEVDRSEPVQLVFSTRFRFEEPIATRLVDLASGNKRSRWLVANQLSPALALEVVETRADGGLPLLADLWSYGRAGFLHILPLGLDHLLFVLLLMLASRSLRQLVGQITLFTLAHSITLIMASYRVIEPPAGLVEPLIALSIVWVAFENLRSSRLGVSRYAVVFGFGLLHGMGFAGALAELELPRTHFLAALVSFNLGVEAGQLAFLGLLFLLLGYWRNYGWYRRRVVMPLSALSGALAAVWLVQRL